MRAVDAAELFGAGMDMHEASSAAAECRTACSSATAVRPCGRRSARRGRRALMRVDEPRIGADAEIAGVAGMQRHRRDADGGRWCRPAAQSSPQSARRDRTPPATSGCRRGSRSGCCAAHRSFASCAISAAPGEVSTGAKAGASSTPTRSVSMSSGRLTTTGPGRPFAAV